MPLAVPLHIRIALEYAIVVGINAAIAAIYTGFANANFFLALAVGISLVAGFWVAIKLYPPTRGRGIHILTFLALVATAALIFWLV